MSLQLRVVQPADLDEILDYEKRRLAESVADEMERNFQEWNSRWRREALEHYISLGWSFLARDSNVESTRSAEGLLVGYFLAQPLLFLDGQTQALWVEHLQYTSLQARDLLCDLAYRTGREKHFQKVYFPNLSGVANAVKSFKPEVWQPQVYEIKTTKT